MGFADSGRVAGASTGSVRGCGNAGPDPRASRSERSGLLKYGLTMEILRPSKTKAAQYP